jgi:hypothetical protein
MLTARMLTARMLTARRGSMDNSCSTHCFGK